MNAVAKPPDWSKVKRIGRDRQWDDTRYGFTIVYDPDDDEDARYIATWGEGAEDCFATLKSAKQWCQATIDEWVRENVLLTGERKHTTEWQPIESAPEDGKCLLAIETDSSMEMRVLDRDENGNWIHEGEPTFCHGYYYRPTYWMPLPDLPSITR